MDQQLIHEIPTAKIISRFQVRRDFDEAEIAELAQSVREVGIQQPIKVRSEGDQFVIIFGERRWRAAKLAALTTIPAIVSDGEWSESERLQTQLIENLQRRGLSVRDKSAAIGHLMSASGLTATEAASKLGLSAATVAKLLSLSTLSEPILAGVDAGTISLSSAYELSQIDDPHKQAELAALSAEGRLTRDAMVAAKKALKPRNGATPTNPPRSRVTIAIDEGRTITFAGGDLGTIDQLIAWLEDLLGKARRARPQSLTLDTFIKMRKDQAKT